MSRSASPSEPMRAALRAATVLLALAASPSGRAAPRETATEALARLFAPPAVAVKDTLFLTDAQAQLAERECGASLPSKIVTRYSIRSDASEAAPVAAWAYVDSHIVRTLSETLLILLDPAGRVTRVEVLSFDEPPEYLPSRRWLEQFEGRELDGELRLRRAIRALSGATLSSSAATDAVRRALAVHRAVTPSGEEP